MANIYVRSTDGNNSDSGATWALAKSDVTGAAAIDAAGDNIYLSSAHAESTAAAVSFALAGTAASPTTVMSVSDAAEPPTTYTTGASITTTGTSNISWTVTSGIVLGVTMNCGTSTGSPAIQAPLTTGGKIRFVDCAFNMNAIGSSGAPIYLSGSSGQVEVINGTVYFSASGQTVRNNISAGSRLTWIGGGIASGSTSPNNLVTVSNSYSELAALDLSNGGSSMNIFAAGNNTGTHSIRSSKLPSGWSGSLVSGTVGQGERFLLYNCDSGDTHHQMQVVTYAGNIISETTYVRSSHVGNGETPISWKMVTTANADELTNILRSPDPMLVWIPSAYVGVSKTITGQILHDSATALTDAEIWLEVEVYDNSGFPLATLRSDHRASLLATAANQTSSSDTWTTTGMTNPNKQKLEVTFTPQEIGFCLAYYCMAKPSYTVYAGPEAAVT